MRLPADVRLRCARLVCALAATGLLVLHNARHQRVLHHIAQQVHQLSLLHASGRRTLGDMTTELLGSAQSGSVGGVPGGKPGKACWIKPMAWLSMFMDCALSP